MPRCTSYVLSVTLLFCTPPALAGDGPVPPPLFPVEGFDTKGQGPARAITGDFNGDGLPDLVATVWRTVYDSDVVLLLGEESGGFTVGGRFPVGGTYAGPLVAADLDGDGLTDLVAGNVGHEQVPLSGGVSVLLGLGGVEFAAEQRFAEERRVLSLGVGDFNGDDLPDLVFTDYPWGGVQLMPGLGDAEFGSPQPAGPWESPWYLAVGDFDGDGVEDVAAATEEAVVVARCNGDGTFGEEQRLEAGWGDNPITVSDLDGDGALDIVIPGFVHLNRGDGTFLPAVRFDAGGGAGGAVVVADFDEDGALDLAVPVDCSHGSPPSDFCLAIVPGSGNGEFGSPRPVWGAGPTWYPVAADFNGDGSVDLAVPSIPSHAVWVLLGRGDGSFVTEQRFDARLPTRFIATGDLDGDGDLDLVAAAGEGESRFAVMLGRGDGGFVQPSIRWGTGLEPEAILLADLNGDGVLDVATANRGSDDVWVLLGQGDAWFTYQEPFPVGQQPAALAMGDLTGDGIADLAVANWSSDDVSLLEGRGDGSFEPERRVLLFLDDEEPAAIGIADLNLDGAGDLVVAVERKVVVRLGRGDGSFEREEQYWATWWPAALTLDDLNGDDVPDLVVAGDDLRLWFGVGDGTFVGGQSLDTGSYREAAGVTVRDLNGDDWPDLAVVFDSFMDQPQSVSVLLNLGDGTFAPARRFSEGCCSAGIAAGDFDGDGRVDLAGGRGEWESVSILLNQGQPILEVAIDIRPGSVPNSVNPRSEGVIQVALLGSAEIGVEAIHPGSLSFGPGEAAPLTDTGQPGFHGTGREDLNRDGIPDLMLFFRVSEIGIACGDEAATLRGVLSNGMHFEGTDSIVTRGCPPARWRHETHDR